MAASFVQEVRVVTPQVNGNISVQQSVIFTGNDVPNGGVTYSVFEWVYALGDPSPTILQKQTAGIEAAATGEGLVAPKQHMVIPDLSWGI